MAVSWKCVLCGQEGNEGRFCSTCGAPRPSEITRKLPPEERKDLSLSEARAEMLPAGWLAEVKWSSSESGMMMGSLHNREETLRWSGDGSVTLKLVDSHPYQTDKTSEYLVRPSEAEAVRELVLRENLAAWAGLRELPPEPWGMPFDRSYNSSLQLRYETDEGEPAGTYTVGIYLAKRHGGGKVLEELWELWDRCRERGTLFSETETPGAFAGAYPTAAGFVRPGDDAASDGKSWTCPCCGALVGEHRFCPECGTPRP